VACASTGATRTLGVYLPCRDKWGGSAYATAGGPNARTVPRLTNQPFGVTVTMRGDGVNFGTALRLLGEGDRRFKLTANYKANS
jgi:hypothetical protein